MKYYISIPYVRACSSIFLKWKLIFIKWYWEVFVSVMHLSLIKIKFKLLFICLLNLYTLLMFLFLNEMLYHEQIKMLRNISVKI